jgi:hypothetical protein
VTATASLVCSSGKSKCAAYDIFIREPTWGNATIARSLALTKSGLLGANQRYMGIIRRNVERERVETTAFNPYRRRTLRGGTKGLFP